MDEDKEMEDDNNYEDSRYEDEREAALIGED